MRIGTVLYTTKILIILNGNVLFQPPELHVPTIIKLDLEDLNSIPSVAKEIITSHGHIDVLINNAGISYRGVAVETDISVDIKLMVVNYFGHVALTKG